eukprot:NODE_19_length_47148_cov_1.447810.p4 type:complete len:694 gc:universal NODE_19_length_47148_cov_1.447810:10416-8335(-)
MEFIEIVLCHLHNLLHSKEKPYFMKIYKSVYECIRAERHETLYQELAKYLENFCNKTLYTLEQTDVELLEYSDYWERYYHAILILDKVCVGLNKIITRSHDFVSEHEDEFDDKSSSRIGNYQRMNIFGLGLHFWEYNLLQKMNVGNQFSRVCIQEIKNLRGQVDSFHSLNLNRLKSAVHSFYDVGLQTGSPFYYYEINFEESFLSETEIYYRNTKLSFNNIEIILKMNQVLKTIKAEDKLAESLLIEITFPKYQGLINSILVEPIREEIVACLPSFIQKLDHENSEVAFLLLNRLENGIEFLKRGLSQQVDYKGSEIIRKHSSTLLQDPTKFILDCKGLKTIFEEYIKIAFQNNADCFAAVDQGFVIFLNSTQMPMNIATYLAKYFDYIIRKRKDVEYLPIAVDFFRYVTDKDLFLLHYSKLLSKRLLNGGVSIKELESAQILEFQKINGQEYTVKLQKMLQDVDISADLSRNFKGNDFSSTILTTGSWPVSETSQEILPPNLYKAQVDEFSKYYNDLHNGRRLKWHHQLSRVILKCSLEASFEIDCPLPCFYLLDSISCNQFKEVGDKTYLKSLAALGIVLEQGNSIILNMKFQPKKFLIKIPFILESNVEAEDISNQIKQDRKYYLMALIAKIMKERKIIPHSKLVAEVISSSLKQFKPNLTSIKESIDSLIERQYIKRDEVDFNMLVFIS